MRLATVRDQDDCYSQEDLLGTANQPHFSKSSKAHDNQISKTCKWLQTFFAKRVDFQLMGERKTPPPQLLLELGNRGFFGLQLPKIHGGLELSYADSYEIYEQLASFDISTSLLVGVNNVIACPPIVNFARPEIKAEILNRIATGRQLVGIAASEPAAGSNLKAIESVARKVKGGFVLNGAKCWISLASWGGHVSVLANTLDESGNNIGFSSFLVDLDWPGVEIGKEHNTLGVRPIEQNELSFDQVFVPEEYLLGEVGDGLEVFKDSFVHGRIVIGVASIGVLKRCAQIIHNFSSSRRVATGMLCDTPVVQRELSNIVKKIEVLEHLRGAVVSILDEGGPAPTELALVMKLVGAEWAFDAADCAVQLQGARGFMEENVALRMLRDSRLFRIFEGSNEALYSFLGSQQNCGDESNAYISGIEVSRAILKQVLVERGETEDSNLIRFIEKEKLKMLAMHIDVPAIDAKDLIASIEKFERSLGRINCSP
jgi:alkylation response protein AidB-like acyl-CoA dehydrogenase